MAFYVYTAKAVYILTSRYYDDIFISRYMEMFMNINIKLMVTLNKMSYFLLESLSKDLKKRGISNSEYTVLAHLNAVNKEKTQKLGEVSFISSGTITHTVNKLIKLDYVQKKIDENDKRICWVIINEKGRAAFEKINKAHLVYLNELLSEFSDEEKEEFIKQIKYFGKKIEIKVKGEKND